MQLALKSAMEVEMNVCPPERPEQQNNGGACRLAPQNQRENSLGWAWGCD
eukprot:m.159102 g.159102  ORF g.159102 m.159102 type:complete len:50 (-) comp11740_c0_seq1:428-577(-)